MTVTVNGWCELSKFADVDGERYHFNDMIGEDVELPQTLISLRFV